MISLAGLRSQVVQSVLCSHACNGHGLRGIGLFRNLSLLLIVFILPIQSYASPGSRSLDDTCLRNSIESVSRGAALVDPNITVRLANPQFNCATQEYCLDVQFQSDIANKELFGMNVRFFYDDVVLELINFRDYQGGYGPVAPNPPTITYSATGGPALFNFGGGSDYVNGAIQKTNANAPPIYISTTSWTKLYQICFTVDDPNANVNNFCPSVVWDLEADPANGGFPPGSAGVVMTVVNGSGSSNSLEHVEQFNWAYSGNGTPPYGAPAQITCSSIDCGACNLLVSSTADTGTGSLRDAITCASNGDTITFATSMAGATITINTSRLVINKNIYIRSSLSPRVKITSTIAGLFEIAPSKTVEFKDIDITSGITIPDNQGAAFKNSGILKIVSCKVYKNANLPTGQYLIRNLTGSQIILTGSCFIQTN